LAQDLLAGLLGPRYAFLWKTLISDRIFSYTYKDSGKKISGTVKYAVGQPMGALSSWSFG
jgi:hypothetical protein